MEPVTTDLFQIKIPGKFRVEPKHKFRGREFQRASLYDGMFYDYFAFVQSGKRAEGGRNSRKFNDYIYGQEERDEWLGGSYQDLVSEHTDFKEYNEALKSLSSGEVWKRMSQALTDQMVRRRSRSEHDGEFDFDKRWDTSPFQRREKSPQKIRIIRLFAESSFSAYVSAEQINKYGAFVGAIIHLLEKNGIQVELYACYTATNHTNGSSNFFRTQLKVKRADEYLPMSQILKVFSAVWYRRAMFSMIVAHAENSGDGVCESLGSPFSFGRVFESVKNEMFIYSVPSIEDQNKIIEKLIESLVGISAEGGNQEKSEDEEVAF